jgi:myo-inositol 2-dehydrogenase/D-chiro-inositol 1-dehydrogenase
MTRRMIWAGCGRHAEQMLLPQLVRHDVELVGVCDIDRRAAERVARRHGVPHVATDFAELLALPGLDAAGMAAGPVPHRDLSIAALARGLHVFMEKPCGASAADAQAIADAARAAERTVGVGFMKRFSTANRIAHNVVKAPGFGPVVGFFGEYMTAPTYFAGAADYTPFTLALMTIGSQREDVCGAGGAAGGAGRVRRRARRRLAALHGCMMIGFGLGGI